MNILLLGNFNNYFNRIFKKYDTISEYMLGRNYSITDNTNFRVMDGINTTHVFTMSRDNDFVPDYAIVYDDDGNILSRWFIMEWKLLSGTQYTSQLRRDVIADYFETIKNSPVFVEKGFLSNSNNPLIFNKEDMTYNEIKTKETLLKDKTQIGWLVGYFIQKLPDSETEKKFTTKYSHIEGSQVATPISDIDPNININMDDASNTPTYGSIRNYKTKTKSGFNQSGYAQPLSSGNWTMIINGDQTFKVAYDSDYSYEDRMIWRVIPSVQSLFYSSMFEWLKLDYRKKAVNLLFKPNFDEAFGKLNNATIDELDGKLVKDENDNLFYLRLEKENKIFEKKFTLENQRGVCNKFISLLNDDMRRYYTETLDDGGNFMVLSEEVTTYIVRAVPASIYEQELSVTVKNSRNHLGDAPYDMFCMPYDIENKKQVIIRTALKDIRVNNNLSLAMAKGLATQAGGLGQAGTYVYDIQYLPYCPIEELKENAILEIDKQTGDIIFNIRTDLGFILDKDYSVITTDIVSADNEIAYLFWGTKSRGTFNIPYKFEVPSDPIGLKVCNETQSLRVCSPNYSGLFEFSPAKNAGVSYFNVDYTYKPYNPYIHINPDFKLLYGKDYNDARGLIIGGDFSLATLNDRFVQYELNNKNYQQMFDREIQSMEINNKLGLGSDIIAGLMGVGTAGIAGSIAGGPVGGAVAGIGSLVGGAIDIGLGQAGYQESRSFKKDMFGYSLGNIKALPRSLAKTTAFTNNNKVFPFIEEYDCTEVEKEALKQKIKYNGMTIMIIDKIANYVSSEKHFFKGQLIRADEIGEDAHIVNVIYEEINKGVYL